MWRAALPAPPSDLCAAGGGGKPGDPFQTLSRSLPPVKSWVCAVSLMKSERIGGRLVYTELYRKELE